MLIRGSRNTALCKSNWCRQRKWRNWVDYFFCEGRWFGIHFWYHLKKQEVPGSFVNTLVGGSMVAARVDGPESRRGSMVLIVESKDKEFFQEIESIWTWPFPKGTCLKKSDCRQNPIPITPNSNSLDSHFSLIEKYKFCTLISPGDNIASSHSYLRMEGIGSLAIREHVENME